MFVKNLTQFHLVDHSHWALSVTLLVWCMWIISVCLCVNACAHLCIWACGAEVNLDQDTVQVDFWDKVSHMAWGLLVGLGRLVSEPQGSACLCLSGTWTVKACHHLDLSSRGFWGLNAGLHTYTASTVRQLSPSPEGHPLWNNKTLLEEMDSALQHGPKCWNSIKLGEVTIKM